MPHINKCQMLSLNISLKGISQEEQDTISSYLGQDWKELHQIIWTQPSKIIVSIERKIWLINQFKIWENCNLELVVAVM
mgnify:CR=1 FL=1